MDGLHWAKSSYSSHDGSCVETAALPDGGRAVRDTKDQGKGPILWFSYAEWRAFVTGVKNNEFWV